MANNYMESQSNSTYNIILSVLESNYSKTKHAVPVSDSMKFSELKDYIKTTFHTNDFDIFFVEMFLSSNDPELDNKTLDYFLFKDGSELNVTRKDISYQLDYVDGKPAVLPPPKLERSIGGNKWSEAHVWSYLLDKPVRVQYGMGYTYIITPNGKRYSGQTEQVIEDFYVAGYTEESFASKDEIFSILSESNNVYYSNII